VPAWIYFIHPPRQNFADTMSEEEDVVWREHFQRLKRLNAEGVLVLAGPTLSKENDGIVIFEAPDEETARKIMNEDPTITSGIATGELRPMRVSLLRGRD
jgi:uncharacterized protein YciI